MSCSRPSENSLVLRMPWSELSPLPSYACNTTAPAPSPNSTQVVRSLQSSSRLMLSAPIKSTVLAWPPRIMLSVADNMIRGGQARTVLLIGAESMSRLLDWSDRTTCVLFGDGAGAVVLQAHEGKGDNSDQGILNTRLFSDGRLHDMLYVDGGPSSTRTTGFLRMQGKEVFRHAVTNISAAITASAEAAGIDLADIDWFVPHQANQRILDG